MKNKVTLISSEYMLLLYDLAQTEAAWHAEALSRYISVDEFNRDRLLKLHLLNILGWNTAMVDEIEILERRNIERCRTEKELDEIKSIFMFYQEVNPIVYYDFLLQKIGDPYRISIVWGVI
jgi:hypothetical protein